MAQRGDRDAFGVLARTSADRLFATAQRMLRDPDRFDAWMHRLVVNACYAELRSARQWGMTLQLLPADRLTERDEMLSVIDRDELDRGFRRLPPDQRSILVLRHYLGLSP